MSDLGSWFGDKTKEAVKDVLGDDEEGDSFQNVASEAWSRESDDIVRSKSLKAPSESERVEIYERALPTATHGKEVAFDQLTPESVKGGIALKYDSNGNLGVYCESNKLFLQLPEEIGKLAKQVGLKFDTANTEDGVRLVARVPGEAAKNEPERDKLTGITGRDGVRTANDSESVKVSPLWTPVTDRKKVLELLREAQQGRSSKPVESADEFQQRVLRQREAQRMEREREREPGKPPVTRNDYEQEVREDARRNREQQRVKGAETQPQEKVEDKPKTREQLLIEEKAKAPDVGNVAFVMRDGSPVEIKFPGKAELSELPVAALQKMFADNQIKLKRVLAEFQTKLPMLGFHGTSLEGAEGLQSSRSAATSGLDVWTYKNNSPTLLADMASAAHKAKSIYADRVWSSGDERPGPIVVVKLDGHEAPRDAARTQHKISNQWQMSRTLSEQSIDLSPMNYGRKVLGVIPRSAFDGLGYPFQKQDLFTPPRPDDAFRQEIAIALQAQKIMSEALKMASGHFPVQEIKAPAPEKRTTTPERRTEPEKKKISVMRR